MSIATAASAALERPGAATFKGNPLTLIGPALRPGAKAPDFQAVGQDLSTVSLATFRGQAAAHQRCAVAGYAHLRPADAPVQ